MFKRQKDEFFVVMYECALDLTLTLVRIVRFLNREAVMTETFDGRHSKTPAWTPRSALYLSYLQLSGVPFALR